jgi:hypothetical protein
MREVSGEELARGRSAAARCRETVRCLGPWTGGRDCASLGDRGKRLGDRSTGCKADRSVVFNRLSVASLVGETFAGKGWGEEGYTRAKRRNPGVTCPTRSVPHRASTNGKEEGKGGCCGTQRVRAGSCGSDRSASSHAIRWRMASAELLLLLLLLLLLVGMQTRPC